MINWQVIAQLISLGVIIIVGPAIIILLSLNKSNL
uniref:Photosystem II reaction center protein Psb30 n=1 Tax=Laurencia verruciformis TaxID=3073068 RepID=A0AA51RDT1_9FLOR|nr:Photosystem II reaction center protein Ycf12 [Laurencia obtusa]WMP12199.1 Photosystem II reaction center protein Ycf12 [Laurencia verruciformis]WMP12842.1 Photosystem II reaction center protein Ycf12 [Laurencia obtusa]